MGTSLPDALEKIQYYLENEDERKEIAARGQRKVEQGFSYRERIKDMMDVVQSE